MVEINTLQAVHPALRERLAMGVTALARPKGMVLAICRGRESHEAPTETPPFAMTPEELTSLFQGCGWVPTRAPDEFLDDGTPPRRRLRALFRKNET